EPSTASKYCSPINAYFHFCSNFNLPTSPSKETLCAFVSTMCRSVSHRTHTLISPRTVSMYLSGIAAYLEKDYPNIQSITNSKSVRATLHRCMKQFSRPISRKSPLNLLDLELASRYMSRSFDDGLFTTILFVGFHGLHHLGELIQPDPDKLKNERK
ncbi:hypothetical protein CROQUDRAFT_33037, partial [Cronartium quercuum f. sp. fusiforme G11]